MDIAKEYVICINGQNYGPVYPSSIRFLLENKKVSPETFLFDPEVGRWKLVGDIPDFKETVPKKPSLKIDRPLIFVVLNGRLNGPFTSTQIVKKIQDKQLRPYDFLLVEGQKELMYVRDIQRLFDEFGVPPEKASIFSGLDDVLTKKEFDSMMERVYKENPEVLRKQKMAENKAEQDDEEEEVASFIHGEHFEVVNDPIWVLPEEVTGKKGEPEPTRYLDIVRLLQEGKLTKKAPIRKVWDKNWQKIADVYEFNAQTVRKVVDVGGLRVEKIFIQRQNPRAAYFSPVQITFGEKEIRGTCTSISLGGCFIEMNIKEINLHDMMRLKFMAGAIPLEFEVDAESVFILPKKPQGIGFKFHGLEEEPAEEIKDFVERYISKMKANVKAS